MKVYNLNSSEEVNPLLSFKYEHSKDFPFLKKRGVLASGDLFLHLEKGSLMDKVCAFPFIRSFGAGKNLIHDYQLHLAEELANTFITQHPEYHANSSRIRSHIIFVLKMHQKLAGKLNALKTLSSADIEDIIQLVIDKLKLNLYSKNNELINKMITKFNHSDEKFNEFLGSKTMRRIMELCEIEEFSEEDMLSIYEHFKEASFITNKNSIAVHNFCVMNPVPKEIKQELKSLLVNFTDVDQVMTSPMLQELSLEDITSCYNYYRINHAMNEHKASHPMLYPNHKFKDYFEEEDPLVLERAFHPHIHRNVLEGKEVIKEEEVEELSKNGILIADIDRKIKELQGQRRD